MARRPRHHRHRRALPAVHLLHGHGRRRRLEDDGRRAQVAQHHGRADLGRLDGRGGGCGQQSGHHLRRHGIVEDPQQRLDRQRHLQVDRWRQDVEVHRPARCRPDRHGADQSDQPRRGLRRVDRRSVQGHQGTWRLPYARWRQDLAADLLPQQRSGCRRHRVPARQPQGALHRHVARPAPALVDHLGRHRWRHLQVGRRWRPLDEAGRRAPDRAVRARQHRRQRRHAEPGLRAGRGQAGSGPLPFGRWRGALDAGQRRDADHHPAVLLHHARRRSEQCRRRLRR